MNLVTDEKEWRAAVIADFKNHRYQLKVLRRMNIFLLLLNTFILWIGFIK